MYSDMEYIVDIIKEGKIISIVEDVVGDIQFLKIIVLFCTLRSTDSDYIP
ncbi:hypothetical protein [Anaeromicrobium sediminis]|nr:hypothetical protein [Anaeromicrobium sediminis]